MLLLILFSMKLRLGKVIRFLGSPAVMGLSTEKSITSNGSLGLLTIARKYLKKTYPDKYALSFSWEQRNISCKIMKKIS